MKTVLQVREDSPRCWCNHRVEVVLVEVLEVYLLWLLEWVMFWRQCDRQCSPIVRADDHWCTLSPMLKRGRIEVELGHRVELAVTYRGLCQGCNKRALDVVFTWCPFYCSSGNEPGWRDKCTGNMHFNLSL
jgi:hypothetical protein